MAANPSGIRSASAGKGRDLRRPRRPAVWPWLVMPLVVLVVFYGLHRVHKQPPAAPAASATQPR